MLPITDPRMTRFMISLEQGVELVWHAFEDMDRRRDLRQEDPLDEGHRHRPRGGPRGRQEIVGIRPGEKLHEQMIGLEDAAYTYEYDIISRSCPPSTSWDDDAARIKDGRKVAEDFSYTSDNNPSG